MLAENISVATCRRPGGGKLAATYRGAARAIFSERPADFPTVIPSFEMIMERACD
jgi:hypothetical protein